MKVQCLLALTVILAAAAPVPAQSEGKAVCTTSVKFTDVSVVDVRDGVALKFTTTPDQVLPLRSAVEGAGRWYHMHHPAKSDGKTPEPASQEPVRMLGSLPLGFLARVEDIPGGAALILSPMVKAQMNDLRASVARIAKTLESGGCL